MTIRNLTASSFLQDASFNNIFLISERTTVGMHAYLVRALLPLKSCVFLMQFGSGISLILLTTTTVTAVGILT